MTELRDIAAEWKARAERAEAAYQKVADERLKLEAALRRIANYDVDFEDESTQEIARKALSDESERT